MAAVGQAKGRGVIGHTVGKLGQLRFHLVEAIDVGFFELHGLLAGVAHRQEGEAVFGYDVHGMLHRETEVVFQLVFGRLKIELPEDFRYLRQNLLDVAQNILVLLPENLRHLQAGDGGNLLAVDRAHGDVDAGGGGSGGGGG